MFVECGWQFEIVLLCFPSHDISYPPGQTAYHFQLYIWGSDKWTLSGVYGKVEVFQAGFNTCPIHASTLTKEPWWCFSSLRITVNLDPVSNSAWTRHFLFQNTQLFKQMVKDPFGEGQKVHYCVDLPWYSRIFLHVKSDLSFSQSISWWISSLAWCTMLTSPYLCFQFFSPLFAMAVSICTSQCMDHYFI